MTDSFDAYVFDLYGTLVDYTSLGASCASFAPQPESFVLAWRAKQVSYTFAATLMDRYIDFDTITMMAFDYVAASNDHAPSTAERSAAIAAWSLLPAYADVVPALVALRSRGAKIAILSNGTPRSIATTIENANIVKYFDAVLSVDTVRRFKPHPSVYDLVCEQCTMTPERIAFVSANGWDATGAAEFGFRVYWCNRGQMPAETMGAKPTRVIASLAEFVD